VQAINSFRVFRICSWLLRTWPRHGDLGSSRDDRSHYGDAYVEIVTVGLSLQGSTFVGVPSKLDVDTVPSSCDAPAGDIPRIEAAGCPTLAEGNHTGFPLPERLPAAYY